MSAQTKILKIRDQAKLAMKYLEETKFEEARQIILNNNEILHYNFGLDKFLFFIPSIKISKTIPKKIEALRMIIQTGFEIFADKDYIDELVFFAAANCDIEKLNYCVNRITETEPSKINQVREGDTILTFLIKYGNIFDEKFSKCIKLLIDSKIDVNRTDYYSESPIKHLKILYFNSRKKNKESKVVQNLEKCIKLLLETKKIDISTVDEELLLLLPISLENLNDFNSKEEVTTLQQDKDILFQYLLNNKEHAFTKSKKILIFLNADDGNDTFLQLCCEKNLKIAAEFLIKNGADLSKTTQRNKLHPIELAARRNNQEIFDMLLKTNKIIIDQELFRRFLRNRPKHIKAEYFDKILKHKNLDLNLQSSNGNTPLHYAIIFSSPEAISSLLKRGASLLVKNDSDKCPLDYISAEDLENQLNKCIIPDNYNDINNGKYEIALNYHNLIEEDVSELSVIEKISNYSKFCHLLGHPLISSFLDIKWKLVKSIYQRIFALQLMFYVISILSFMNLSLLNYFGLPLVLAYISKILLIFNWQNNKLDERVDMAIASIICLSLFISNNIIQYYLGIVATLFMAISFHLFCRFNPQFSYFHALLIKVLSEFLPFLFYIFSMSAFFGATFYIFILISDESLVQSYFNNLIKDFYHYCIIGLFLIITVAIIIISSVTSLQEINENFDNNLRIIGYKNTIIFLKCIEKLYQRIKFIKIQSPLVFENMSPENAEINVDETDKKQKRVKKQTINCVL